jgi:hypothetical protein
MKRIVLVLLASVAIAAAAMLPSLAVADERGDTIRLPSGWTRATSPLAPQLLDPHEILAVGTFDLEHLAADRGACVGDAPPAGALGAMQSDDALIWIVEWEHAASTTRRRPADFAKALKPRSCVRASYPDLRARSVFFQSEGRMINAFVVVGDDASKKRQRQATSILNNLQLAKL